MNSGVLKRCETLIVIVLLLASDSINIPPQFDNLIKLTSYGLVGLLIIRQRFNRLAYVATRDIFLLALIFLAFSSVLWSDNLAETTNQLKALLRAVILSIYLATRYTPREQIQVLGWTLGLAAVLSLIVSIFLPEYGTGVTNGIFVWKGIYGQKQYLARSMVIGVMLFLLPSTIFQKRWLNLSLVGLSLLLIWMSTSRTGMAFCLVAVSSVPLYKVVRQRFKIREAILILVILILGSISFLVFTNLETIVVDIMGKNLEFNGRLPLWQRAIEVGSERPWLGYGYAGFWSSPVSYDVSRYLWITTELGSSHSHNGFIDTFLQLGLIGLISFLVHFSIVLFKIVKQLFLTQKIEVVWMLQMVILMFLYNMFELNTILTGNFLWIYYMTVSFSISLLEERHEKRSRQKFVPPFSISTSRG